MTPRTWFLMLGMDIYVSMVNMYYLLLYQYIAHCLLLCSGIMMLLTYSIVDFYFFL